MAENLVTIKKIRTAAGEHEIDATYLGGHTFTDIEGMVHGVIDTYVIPTSKEGAAGYDDIVKSGASEIVTTVTVLNSLVSPANASGSYKLGDVILMGQESDGEKIFDRWVSAVDGENITLSVLETKVAKHYHTIGTSTGNALTGVATKNMTSVIPVVGDEVTVVDGNDIPTEVVTSVTHDDKGEHDFTLTAESGDGSVGHSHTVDSHAHDVSFNPKDFVGESVDAYTDLNTATYVKVTSSTVEVADVQSNDTTITYATGSGSTDTFVKTLKDSTLSTSEESLTTGANVDGLVTIEDDTLTTAENGAHGHTVSVETTSDVVTSVTLVEKVMTGVSETHSNAAVAENVVTGVASDSATIKVFDESNTDSIAVSSATWSCSVEDDGVLVFDWSGNTMKNVSSFTKEQTVVTSVTPTSTKQTGEFEITLTPSYGDQTSISGKVQSTGIAIENGAHTHGFSHIHTIPSHTHTIAAHSHTYDKSVTDATATAYVSLSTASHASHTHGTKTVVASVTDGNSAFTYVTSGTKTAVVKDLKDEILTYTSTSVEPSTDTKYVKLTGDITFPGLTVTSKALSTTTVTPAVAGTEVAIKDITFSDDAFVTSVDSKTSANIGGDPAKA
jgi:hypothetical protein